MNPTALSLPLLLLLLLSALPPSLSDSSDDQPVAVCVPGNCGTITNISYPFWVSDQQSPSCGFPQFKLHCDGDTLSLQTSNISYYVQKILYDNHSILVVPQPDPGSPNSDCPLYRNLSFTLTPFTVSHTNMDLFIIYNCTVPQQPFYYRVPCTEYNMSMFLGSNSSELEQFQWFKKCETVEIPVLGFPGAKASDYNRLVKDGFLLEWSAADCSDCSSSGGQCGYNVERDSFMCICKDRTHSRVCNTKRSFLSHLHHKAEISGGVIGGIVLFVLAIWFYFGIYKKRSVSLLPSKSEDQSTSYDHDIVPASDKTSVPLLNIASAYTEDRSVEFSYKELATATNEFSMANKIGEGGFGAVYYADLKGKKTAIKKMDMSSTKEFLAELKVLTRVHHINLVHLIGYCTEGSLFLVYEYIENGNLSQHLRDPCRDPLSWSSRFQIALDSARALEYIHEHTVHVYIHRDIKSANILIDNNFHAKVADFGLTKLVEVSNTQTRAVGTFGYMPPEYQYGEVSPKADVFAFGVVLYELISAKEAVVTESSGKLKALVSLFERSLKNPNQKEELQKLVDPRLSDNYPLESLYKMAQLAKACTQEDPQLRPDMRSVVVALRKLSSTSIVEWDLSSS